MPREVLHHRRRRRLRDGGDVGGASIVKPPPLRQPGTLACSEPPRRDIVDRPQGAFPRLPVQDRSSLSRFAGAVEQPLQQRHAGVVAGQELVPLRLGPLPAQPDPVGREVDIADLERERLLLPQPEVKAEPQRVGARPVNRLRTGTPGRSDTSD